MIIKLSREEALACIIALERERKPYHWQQSALTKFLRKMNLQERKGANE